MLFCKLFHLWSIGLVHVLDLGKRLFSDFFGILQESMQTMIIDDVFPKISWLKRPKNGSKYEFLLFAKKSAQPSFYDVFLLVKRIRESEQIANNF